MQSHTEIDVAITCQAFFHCFPSLEDVFSPSFKFRHTCIYTHGCQLLRHIHVQGWVDGTVNHLLSSFISISSLGYYAAARGTTYSSGHRVLSQAEVSSLQHLPFPTCPSISPLLSLKGSPGGCIYKPLFSPQPSAWKLGNFGYRNNGVNPTQSATSDKQAGWL